jgi:hypothetical protein
LQVLEALSGSAILGSRSIDKCFKLVVGVSKLANGLTIAAKCQSHVPASLHTPRQGCHEFYGHFRRSGKNSEIIGPTESQMKIGIKVVRWMFGTKRVEATGG